MSERDRELLELLEEMHCPADFIPVFTGDVVISEVVYAPGASFSTVQEECDEFPNVVNVPISELP